VTISLLLIICFFSTSVNDASVCRITSADYLIQLTLNAMLEIATTHPTGKHLQVCHFSTVARTPTSPPPELFPSFYAPALKTPAGKIFCLISFPFVNG
jgi:hypothetical protein